MNSRQLSVRGKLAIAFGGLAAVVVVLSGLALNSLLNANARFTNYVHGVNARALVAAEIRTAVDRRAIAARNLVLVSTPEDTAIEKADVTRAHTDVQQNLAKLKQMVTTGENVSEKARSLVADIDRIEQSYAPVALGIVGLALENKREAAIARMNKECRPLLAALVKASDAYRDYTEARAAGLIAEGVADYASQRDLLVAGCVAAFLAATLAGFVISRSLTRSLGDEPAHLGAIAKRVADGDLSTIENAARAPAGSVLASLAAMQTSLAKIVEHVRKSSDSISTGSSEIAAGNADLSQRTEEQASSLEETASSMEELTGTVKQTAENAHLASELAAGASEVAGRGGDVVRQVVETMGGISESSKKIVDIIGVIDGIAFQTNILALNAAVEAARAGEQGRGFAVVASEVRTLAQRSASAAKEIKALIDDSVGRVDAGSRQVDVAGETMNEVVTSIRRVTDIMGEIAAASREQSAGIDQVNQAVVQMDEVTQQNAALVEQAAAAAQSMHEQAEQLGRAVRVFKLDASADSAVTAQKPAGPTAQRRTSLVARRPARVQAPSPATHATTMEDEWAEM